MCGIAGYVGEFNPNCLELALERLSHRGPDDSGTFFRGNLGLGHSRLSIIDTTDAGHQPMEDDDTGNIIIFNGEIYNYREIREELELEGRKFNTNSDTEVLLAAFSKYGVDFLSRLRGIFAFAFYEAQSGRVFLVRDAFGVKPLYYCKTQQGIAFASELPSLVSLVDDALNRQVCTATAIEHLTFLWSSSDETIFKDIFHLGQGEVCIVEPDGDHTIQNWFLNPLLKSTNKREQADEYYIEGTYRHLSDAVKRQMVSDVPLGAFLSGGLDSTSIVALAREQNPDIVCFTMSSASSGDGFSDDLPFAHKAAQHLKVPLEIVEVDEELLISNLESMICSLGEPIADPAAINTFFISKYARERGIKVLLSGTGGDDVFTGYRRHTAASWATLLRLTPRAVFDVGSKIAKFFGVNSSVTRKLKKLGNSASLAPELQILNFYRWISRSDLASILSPQFRDNLTKRTEETGMLEAMAEMPKSASAIDCMLYLEQKYFLPQHNLLYADRMSMAAGLEVRVPFLDEDLVRFASEIPDSLRQRKGEGKWVLKKAMEQSLPQDLIYRPKTGFGAPLREWVTGPLKSKIENTLSEETIRERGILDYTGFQKMVEMNQSGAADFSYIIFSALCIEIWCQIFIDEALPFVPLSTKGKF